MTETLSKKGGATPKQPLVFKPLDTSKFMRSANRRAPVEDAPSRISGVLYPAFGVKGNE